MDFMEGLPDQPQKVVKNNKRRGLCAVGTFQKMRDIKWRLLRSSMKWLFQVYTSRFVEQMANAWFNINRIRRCILNESISVRGEMMILFPLNKIKKYKILLFVNNNWYLNCEIVKKYCYKNKSSEIYRFLKNF